MGQCLDKDKKQLNSNGEGDWELKNVKKSSTKSKWNRKFRRTRKQKQTYVAASSISDSPAAQGLNATSDLKTTEYKSNKKNLKKTSGSLDVSSQSGNSSSIIDKDKENNPNLGTSKNSMGKSVDLNINIHINYYGHAKKKENTKKNLYHTQRLSMDKPINQNEIRPPVNNQSSVTSSLESLKSAKSSDTTIIRTSDSDYTSSFLTSPKRTMSSPGKRGLNMFNSPKMQRGPRVLFRSPLQKNLAFRREKNNSTSTLFIKDTLNSPNVDEILRCMSTALLYHIKNGLYADDSLLAPIFSERYLPLTKEYIDIENVPDVGTIYRFIKMIFKVQKLPPECAILCLAYIERILASNRIVIHPENWRRIIFGSIIIATKVWEDESVWNVDFLDVFPMLTLNDLNNTENKFLELLQFNVLITGSEYAKYYFELRALSQENGFPLEPLNKELQAKLEARSNSYKSFVPPGVQKDAAKIPAVAAVVAGSTGFKRCRSVDFFDPKSPPIVIP